MTGLGEFIRKSRSAYEEIQTSKASSLKAASFGIFFAKRAIFVKIQLTTLPRESGDFTDTGIY